MYWMCICDCSMIDWLLLLLSLSQMKMILVMIVMGQRLATNDGNSTKQHLREECWRGNGRKTGETNWNASQVRQTGMFLRWDKLECFSGETNWNASQVRQTGMLLRWDKLECSSGETNWNASQVRQTGMLLRWDKLECFSGETNWNASQVRQTGMLLRWDKLECFSGNSAFRYIAQISLACFMHGRKSHLIQNIELFLCPRGR